MYRCGLKPFETEHKLVYISPQRTRMTCGCQSESLADRSQRGRIGEDFSKPLLSGHRILKSVHAIVAERLRRHSRILRFGNPVGTIPAPSGAAKTIMRRGPRTRKEDVSTGEALRCRREISPKSLATTACGKCRHRHQGGQVGSRYFRGGTARKHPEGRARARTPLVTVGRGEMTKAPSSLEDLRCGRYWRNPSG